MPQHDTTPALVDAVNGGDANLVETLLKNGANINVC